MSSAARFFGVAAMIAALIGIPATPASASGNSARIAIYFADVLIAPDSAGTQDYLLLTSSEPIYLQNVTARLDYSGLAGVATISAEPSVCQDSQQVMTCTYAKQYVAQRLWLGAPVAVKPVSGAATGSSGVLKITLTATGAMPASIETKVTIGDGPDLAGGPDQELTTGYGGYVGATLEMGNVGAEAAVGAVAYFRFDYGISALNYYNNYNNCTYTVDGALITCTFAGQLAPGTDYITEPVSLGVVSDTEAPGTSRVQVMWMTPTEFDAFKDSQARQGVPFSPGFPGPSDRVLHLLSKPSETSNVALIDSDSLTTINLAITGNNHADLAACGYLAFGSVGAVVTVKPRIYNVGPATLDPFRRGGPAGVADFVLPVGSSLAEMPTECVALLNNGHPDPDTGNLRARAIRCSNNSSVFRIGQDMFFPVKLRFDEPLRHVAGTWTIVTDPAVCDTCRPDNNPQDDVAYVILDMSALPTTGVQVGLIAMIGALLVVAGATGLALHSGRRRRFTPTA